MNEDRLDYLAFMLRDMQPTPSDNGHTWTWTFTSPVDAQDTHADVLADVANAFEPLSRDERQLAAELKALVRGDDHAGQR